MSSDDFVETAICKVEELQIGEKKLLPFGDLKIIVIRESDDKFVAIGSTCSHYGAPLINGVVHKGYITCPWHGACFNIHTGDIEEFPGCDSIPSYETYVNDGSVFVKALKRNIVKKRAKPLTARNVTNRSTFIIIGGGPAGFQCAETLRQEGFDGRVVLISSEDVPPYDRTKLSKSMSVNVQDILLRNEEHYKSSGIELILGAHCKMLDTKSNIVYLDDGSNLRYDKLFIATGSSPRKHNSLMDNIVNVYCLRTYQDANQIAEKSKDKNVVLIGSSFIVMEIAAYLNGKCKSISVISRSNVPFLSTLGNKIGEQIKKLYISKGVNFYVAPQVDFVTDNQKLIKIKFESTELDTDICVVGIGSEPNTSFLKETDIKLTNSFIEVNQYFETSVQDVYAGGDVVLYPNPLYNNKMMNIAHWQTAQSHGRYAALRMLSKSTSFKSVPFFWSMVFGKGIRFAGTIQDPENSIVEGNLDELTFVAFYFDSENQIIGVATMANDPIAAAFAAALRNSRKLTKSDIETEGFKWVEDIVK